MDRDRQWFESACGLDATQTDRSVSFCAHAVQRDEMLVVPDAGEDERFAGEPLVTGPPPIRFDVGAVLRGPEGRPLGPLCLVARPPRTFSESQRRILHDLAAVAEDAPARETTLRRLHASTRQPIRSVVAEDVESNEHESYLRAYGCPEAQGVFYGRPVGGDTFARMLRQGEPLRG